MSDETSELLKLLQTHFPQLGAQPGLALVCMNCLGLAGTIGLLIEIIIH